MKTDQDDLAWLSAMCSVRIVLHVIPGTLNCYNILTKENLCNHYGNVLTFIEMSLNVAKSLA